MFPNNISFNGNSMVIRNGNQVISMGPGGMKIQNGDDGVIEMNSNGISTNQNERSNNNSRRSQQSFNMFSGNNMMPDFNQIFSNFDNYFTHPNNEGNGNFSFTYSSNNYQPNYGHRTRHQAHSESPNEGLSKQKIAQFPIRKFTKASAKKAEGSVCAICQEEYEVGDKVMSLPCIHQFHKDCISDWLKKKGICPICKTNL